MLEPWVMGNLSHRAIELMRLIMMGMDMQILFNSVPDAVASIANYLQKFMDGKENGAIWFKS